MTKLDDMLDHHSLITSKLKEEIMIPMKGVYRYGSTMQYVIPLEVLTLMPITFRMLHIVGTGGLEITYRKMEMHKLTTDFRKVNFEKLLSTYPLLKNFVELIKEKKEADCRDCRYAVLDEFSSEGSHCNIKQTLIRSNGPEKPFSIFWNGHWISAEDCEKFLEKE